MKTLRVSLLLIAVTWAISASAQGSNHGDGGPDGNYTSLSERLFNLENKHNNFNIFINTSTALQLDNYSGDLAGAFRAKPLRLDIKVCPRRCLAYSPSTPSTARCPFSEASTIRL